MPPSTKPQLNLLMPPKEYQEFREMAVELGYDRRFAAFLVNKVMPVFRLDFRELVLRMQDAFRLNPATFDDDETRFYAKQLLPIIERIAKGEPAFVSKKREGGEEQP